MPSTIDLAAMKFSGPRLRLRDTKDYTVRSSMDRARELYDEAIILEAWRNYPESLRCAREALRELEPMGAAVTSEIEALRLMIAALEAKIGTTR